MLSGSSCFPSSFSLRATVVVAASRPLPSALQSAPPGSTRINSFAAGGGGVGASPAAASVCRLGETRSR